MADAASSPTPVFYNTPVPLDRVRHGAKRFVRPQDYAFARGVNSVPLAAIEFNAASKHYPVVFTAGDPIGAVAVLGFEGSRNVFVDDQMRWAEDMYVPAYVRRYPFVFTRTPDNEFMLCVEESGGHIADAGGEPFFVDGKPSKIVEEALRFSSDYQVQIDQTQAFTKACAAAGLFVDNRASIQLPDGRSVTLQGFRTIDAKRFETLPEATVLDWWRRGWLMLVFAHLNSLGNWQVLANRGTRAARARPAG